MGILLHLFHRKRHTRLTVPLNHPIPSVTIEGRRHRIDIPYVLPKDGQEIHRLDFQHFGLRLLLNTHYNAPIDPSRVQCVLDVGYGTGRWMLEMAQEFSHARIEGVDIEPPAPYIQLPVNCHCTQGNVLHGLPYPDHSFDYTHQRLLVGGIPTYQWPFVMQELVRVTRPGGYVELFEAGSIFHHPGPATKQLNDWWNAGSSQAGFDLAIMPTIDALLVRHGLEHVHMEAIQLPLGKWAGRTGDLLGRDLFEVYKGFKGFYIEKLGVNPALFDQMVALLPEEWALWHTTYECYMTYGRKP